MLEKILQKVPRSLMPLAATGMIFISSCGDGICQAPEQAPEYSEQSLTETQMSALTEEQGIVEELETKGLYLMATCRDGCTYNSGSDCCTCPGLTFF